MSRAAPDTRDPLQTWWRLTLVLLASLALPLGLLAWIAIAYLWFGLREGENVVCHCWADDHQAWQYTAQFTLAVIGFSAGGAASTMALRRAWRLFPVTAPARTWPVLAATAVAMTALAGWLVFFLSALP